MFVAAAAVADYTPRTVADHKLKKTHERLDSIELVETEDILARMSERKQPGQVVVGFAAETNDLLANARVKLQRKGCDAIVANDVSRADSGFGSATDAVTWVTAAGEEDLGVKSKEGLAYDILHRAVTLR